MKLLKLLGKISLAGVISIVILSFLMCFYFLVPVHIENKYKNTDYVWSANAVWIKATEGISWGKYDSNGFNNLTVIKNPDIIVLGSSHMEATNVLQSQTTSTILANKFNGELSVYNMGISGHHFFKVCQYIPTNLELFDSIPKYVIIETSTLNITQDDVDKVITHTVEYTPSNSKGLIGLLQKIPFLRTLYQQKEAGLFKLFMTKNTNENSNDSGVIVQEDKEVSTQGNSGIDESAYSQLFEYLANIEQTYGTEIIIFYHPTEQINKDGSIEFKNGEELVAFKYYADEYGLNFIDMTSDFKDMYYSEHHIAHGFVTGKLGTGHLNRYGHAIIAQALYDEIQQMMKGE